MKKVLSIVLSVVMVMAMFSGLVLFNTSAATAETAQSFKFVNAYTAEQAAKMKGGDATVSATVTEGKVVVSGTTKDDGWGSQVVKISTSTGNDQWAKNGLIDGISAFAGADLSNKTKLAIKFGGTNANLVESVMVCLGSSTKKVAMDCKKFTKDADGYFVQSLASGQYSVAGSGWYDDCKSMQETIGGIIDEAIISVVFNVKAATAVSFTFDDALVYGYNDTEKLGAAIVAAKAAGVDTTDAEDIYFNGSKYTQAQVDAMVIELNNAAKYGNLSVVTLPGIQDWTQTEIDAYNAMAANTTTSYVGTPGTLVNTHLVGEATQALKLTTNGSPNAWTIAFSTRTSTDATVAQQLGDVLGKYKKLTELFKYDGIRIAVQNENGEPVNYKTWDASSPHHLGLKIIGSDQKSYSNAWYPFAQVTYNAGEERYYDGYYYFDFADLTGGWGGNFLTQYATNNWNYGNLYFWFQNGGINNSGYNGGALYISEIQLYRNDATSQYKDGLWEGNYTDESWAALEAAIDTNDPEQAEAARDALIPRITESVTGNVLEGWTTAAVNDVVTANSSKLADYVSDGKNITGDWDKGDFSKNTTFTANGNFSMKANVAFGKETSMGWKNMDRSATKATVEGGGYPALTNKDFSTSEGIRFKLDVTGGSIGRLLVGLSDCKTGGSGKEMYALDLKPEYFGADGYINVPWDAFEAAFWSSNFTTAQLKDVEVVCFQAFDVTEGTTVTISDLQGYKTVTTQELIGDVWEYNYTAKSWANLQAALATGSAAAVKTALAALVPQATEATSDNLMKGWDTTAVQAVVTANPTKVGDETNNYVVDGSHDFSGNTTFTADGYLSMATVDANANMGWKNMDRSGTLATVANGGYPTLTTAGLKDALGFRMKIDVTGEVEAIKLGISNCADMCSEMYVTIKPENLDENGYINIPLSCFEKASWANAFTSADIENMIVFLVECKNAAANTTVKISDLKGYKKVDLSGMIADLWQPNYTDASWEALLAAVDSGDATVVNEAIKALELRSVTANTADFFEGWTTAAVNVVATTNSDKIGAWVSDGTNAQNVWDNADFSEKTVFMADNNFSMTAVEAFGDKSMGWKNMDRSGVLSGKANYGYPTINVTGLSKSEGIRVKIDVSKGGSFGRILLGLSNCTDKMTREMYMLNIKPSMIGSDGYINIPFSAFTPAWWTKAFSTEELENVEVVCFQAFDVTKGTTITFSNMSGYAPDHTAEYLAQALECWEYNYTPESWAKLAAAIDKPTEAGLKAALEGLEEAKIIYATDNLFDGWTSVAVNAVVEANSNKIGDNTNGYAVDGSHDFSGKTTFAANNNFSMTANAANTNMGWKNMDRSGTLAASGANYGYPALANVKGLSKADGIRLKLEVTDGTVDEILVGLSNCANKCIEMYAKHISAANVDSEGYINIPFSYFEKASWAPKFTSDTIEDAVVFLVEATNATKGAKVTISDVRGYKNVLIDPEKLDIWEANYTTESVAAFNAIKATIANDADLAEAKKLLVPVKTKATTGNMLDGWTDTAVNDVVNANPSKKGDWVSNGTNAQDVWDNADFSNDTTFAANNNFSMTAGKAFAADKSMGWKNMDRSGTLAASGANYGYPELKVTGLKKADGIRFKLEVSNGTVGKILIGLSNCTAKMTREMYAMDIKPEYVDADGYINIPFSYFVNAWWTVKFAQDELNDAVVLCVQAFDVTDGATVTISDLKGYKLFKTASDLQLQKLKTLIDTFKSFDIDDEYASEYAAYVAYDNTTDEDLVEDASAAMLELLKKWDINAIDVPGYSVYTQDELNTFDGRSSTWNITKTETGAKFVKVSGSGNTVANGDSIGKVDVDKYDATDTNYGPVAGPNGKTFIDMLGGFTLSDVTAFRFKIENGKGSVQINYKDGIGLWNGLVTPPQKATLSNDYFTFNTSGISTGKFDDWYGGKWTVAEICAKTKYILFTPGNDNLNKNVYGWQVLISATGVDRTELAANIKAVRAIDAQAYADELGAAASVYYTDDATQTAIDAQAKILSRIINKPNAPVVTYSTTGDSITIDAISGAEYKLDDGEWGTSNVFEGLDANTEYTVSVRIAETEDALASEITTEDITTDKGTFGDATITISGTERYLETLTATANDVPEYLGTYTIKWFIGETDTTETGEEFEIPAEAIGKTIKAVLVSDNAEDTCASDVTGTIGKAEIKTYTVPTGSNIEYPNVLGESALEGGDTGTITGTWSWNAPDTIPTFADTSFAVTFTPSGEDADLYDTISETASIYIMPSYTHQSISTESGLTLTGMFLDVEGFEVTADLAPIMVNESAYLALLRAASKADGQALILFYDVSIKVNGEEIDYAYADKLTVTSFVGMDRADETYEVFFFEGGEIVSYSGCVDGSGYLNVFNTEFGVAADSTPV